jgi:hypothetical protein
VGRFGAVGCLGLAGFVPAPLLLVACGEPETQRPASSSRVGRGASGGLFSFFNFFFVLLVAISCFLGQEYMEAGFFVIG